MGITESCENMQEIPGFSGYWSPDNGTSVWSRRAKRRLYPIIHGGYYAYSLVNDAGKRIIIAAHRIVALTYLVNPDNLPFVNHKNGNKLDNRVENLEWITARGNSQHATAMGLMGRTPKEVKQFDTNGNLIATYKSMRVAEEVTGLNRDGIKQVCMRNRKRALAGKEPRIWKSSKGPFIFRYADESPFKISSDSVEDWKIIEDFPNYKISTKGQIYSIVKSIILKPLKHTHGYYMVNLRRNGKPHYCLIHILVAKAYIPNPHDHPFVNHKDGNKENYDVGNLEWVSRSQNSQHAHDTGLIKTKKAIVQYDMNGNVVNEFSSAANAERKTGIEAALIRAACRNRMSAMGFMWRDKSDTTPVTSYKRADRKPVIQISLDGVELRRFISLYEAAKSLGKNRGASAQISYACRGLKTQVYGYRWKWAED
jgi:NUMOD4 motif-containing protein/HNH endonuclease/NUMOD1 domain-containing protein